MQSGYGGVSEIPPFVVEGCVAAQPSIFSFSSPSPDLSVVSAATDMHSSNHHHELKYHALPQTHYQNLQPSSSPSLPTPFFSHFTHFHSIPITQQLFQQPQHQFQLFHKTTPTSMEASRLVLPHQLGLDQDSGPETTSSSPIGSGGGGGGHSFLTAPMSFKLGMNDSGGSGDRDDDVRPETQIHHWQRKEEAGIKELSWRPLDLDYLNRNNKRCKENDVVDTSTSNYTEKTKDNDDDHAIGAVNSNYKVFSELDAIYNPGNGVAAKQTGSGSALTGDEIANIVDVEATPGILNNNDYPNVAVSTETSAGEEVPLLKKLSKNINSKRKRKRRRQQRQMRSVENFLGDIVKHLMEHQEELHKSFLQVMEKREHERAKREEEWKKHEAEKQGREAAAQAQERAFAASREEAIITFLEKITGETIQLPPKTQLNNQQEENWVDENNNGLKIEHTSDPVNYRQSDIIQKILNPTRWPKSEVQALIRVRSDLDSRFQEPGLKGPLWDEVSSTMATLGFQRSAKRCKEKWENINKYFRKTKESGKKRPTQAKTCPYFQQLDQLYSNSTTWVMSRSAKTTAEKHSSELLDAILVGKGNSDGSNAGQVQIELQHNNEHEHEHNDNDDDGDDNDSDDHDNNIEGVQGQQEDDDDNENDEEKDDLHESALFFQRLQS